MSIRSPAMKALLLSSMIAVLAYLYFSWQIDWEYTLDNIREQDFFSSYQLIGSLPIFIVSYLALYFTFCKTAGLTKRILLISVFLSSLVAILAESLLGFLAGFVSFIFLYPAIYKLYVIKRYMRIHQGEGGKLKNLFNPRLLFRDVVYGFLGVGGLFLLLVGIVWILKLLGLEVSQDEPITYGLLFGSVIAAIRFIGLLRVVLGTAIFVPLLWFIFDWLSRWF